jgi:hypothetical protein
MPRHASIETVESDRIRQFARWWLGARNGRDLPSRSDFDPAQWKPLLPYLLVAEAHTRPFRVRYRLVGTAVVYVAGFDFTWQFLDDMLAGDAAEPWVENYRVAYESRGPVYGTTSVPTLHGDLFHYSYAIFPLGMGGEEVAQFVSIEDYGNLQPRVQSTLLDLTIPRARRGAI